MSRYLFCITAAAAVIGGAPVFAATPPVNPPAPVAEPAAAAPSVPGAAVNPPAAATPAESTASAATAAPPAAATGAAANTNATTAPLTSGLPVKDNTGATIGQITALTADPSGKQMATIKMGADSFSVAATSLAVENGAAVVNLSGAQIQTMLHKPPS
jgi:hypothetical protein